MRFFGKLCLMIAVVATVMAQVAQAQRGEDRGPGEGGGGRLFGVSPVRLAADSREVQTALNMRAEQKEKATQIWQQLRDDSRDVFERERGNFRAMRAAMEKLALDASARLAEVLDDRQQQRLLGISIQVNGAAALADPAAAKEFNFTQEQKLKLAEVRDGIGRSFEDAFREMRDKDFSGEERRARFRELRADADKKLMAVLTAEQQQQFKALKGEAVDIDMSQFRRFAGRGGFDGPGRRNGGERDPGKRGSDGAERGQ